MPSYLITGASRGIGYEFLAQVSADPNNTVVGLVRDKGATEAKVAELKRSNVSIVQADITDYDALEKTVPEVSAIVDGKLDYLIANAGLIAKWSGFYGVKELSNDPKRLVQEFTDCFNVNVIGNVNLFNLYLPLIQKGTAKKILVLTSGLGDVELTAGYDLKLAAPYSASKSAINMVVAKYQAQYRNDGILFVGVCPGAADTGSYGDATEEQLANVMEQFGKFQEYSSRFKGPYTPNVAAKQVLDVFNKASLKEGYGGAAISHLGKGEKWL